MERKIYCDAAINAAMSMQVPATVGSATFTFSNPLGFGGGVELGSSTTFEIDVAVGPDPAQPQSFAATGLTLGGQVTWGYLYRFVGLSVP